MSEPIRISLGRVTAARHIPAAGVDVMIRAWLSWAAVRVGYWIRPFDMLADRRRWFWQRRTRCWRFDPEQRALVAELQRRLNGDG